MDRQRRFAEILHNKGEAAQIRQNVSKTVRDNQLQSRPKLVEPIDYETFAVKNKVLLHNDPQRDMLNFPHDDVEVPPPTPKRKLRTVRSTVPASAERDATSLLVRQAIHTYNDHCHMIKFKYASYSGSYQQLPRSQQKDPLQEHVFEIDDDNEEKDDDTLTRGFVSIITKKGWLFKGPDTGKDNIISFTRQFKRRYCMLKQQSDYTYILEIYKDDKKLESKGAIFLDLAQEAVRNIKKGKFCFEIRMNDRPPCLMAAENDAETLDWIKTLNKVINAADNASQVSRDSIREEVVSTEKQEQHKERSIDHPVVKYSRESDLTLTKARQDGRQNLFSVHPDMKRHIFEEDIDDEEEEEVDVFPKPVAERFLLRLESLQTDLQVNLSDVGEPKKSCNPEPFFVTFAIYDAKEGKKISEDFHVDPNEADIRANIPHELLNNYDKGASGDVSSTAPDMDGLKEDWLSKSARQGIFSVVRRHSEIYLVARIEKVLQGALSQCLEPYLKGTDYKHGMKVYQAMRQFCSAIGHYRMPFAWSARPLASTMIGSSEMSLYRYDWSKFTEEEVIKQLQDFKKPDKASKLQVIPGRLRIIFEQLNVDQPTPNTLTTALVPVKPFTDPPVGGPTFEVEEFVSERAALCATFDYFLNHLYVYPLLIKFDSQKTFTKARNIACCVELKDSDDEKAVPLKRIYGHPSTSVFTTTANTTVHHHNTTPHLMDEVKLSLPVQLHDRHHLFFRFYHVSCEASKSGSRLSSSSVRKKDNIETPVGFAWMPLVRDGKVVVGEHGIPVASNVPPSYLVHDTLSPGKGPASADVKWVDAGKQLFKVRLHLVSTVYTQDQHLHNFFQHCEKLEQKSTVTDDMNSVNKIKSLLAVEVGVYVQFLPTLLNQLFLLLTRTVSEDVAINIARVLIHIVSQLHEAEKIEVLNKYVKYVFRPPVFVKGSNQHTVHEELAKQLTNILRPAQTDPQLVNSFLCHAAFFFDVLLKSMTLFLIDSERIKMPRNERFSSDCQVRLQNLLHTVTLHITQRCKESPKEARMANHSLATFVRNCFTLMDRGYVFRLVSKYIENFVPGDSKALCDLKFEFLRIICSHEHYVPLSLPLMRRGMIKNFKDLKHDYTLSDEYRRNHYLTGLLLHELKMAMNEPREVRRSAITVLRNQLAKHSFDDRYASKTQQGRIAALYLPLIGILLDCKMQLFRDSHATTVAPTPVPTPTVMNGDATHMKPESKNQLAPPKVVGKQQPTPESMRKEQAVWDIIAGTTAHPQTPADISLAAQGGKGSTSSLTSSASSDKTEKDGKGKVGRSQSALGAPSQMPTTPYVSRLHKLDISEIRDLLLCLMYIVKNLPDDILLGWFNNSSEHDVIDFFALLALCLQHFQYQGRKKIFTLSMISGSTNQRGGLNMQSFQQRGRPISLSSQRTPSQYGDLISEGLHTPTSSDADAVMRALHEANMATEMGLIVLDILCLFCQVFKKELEERGGDNHFMRTVFQLYLGYLRSPQSETLQKHVFGAWRAFIKKFETVLFQGSADMCGELCYELLRCCSSKLNSTRREACALLYLLMRTNFEFSKKKSFTRVHLQVIISVSQLIGSPIIGLSTTRFQESLAIVNNYANSDKSIQSTDHKPPKKTAFPGEVRDLTKRIRTVLMATAAMKENENDPELLVDLQHSLAKSYASTPELRKTWLQAMAHQHIRRGDFSEAAHCYIHIAALIAEYLKRREMNQLIARSYPQGCQSFGIISPNIVAEESGIKDDSGMQDVQYTEETLVEFLELAAEYMAKAQRYEIMGDIYRIVIPIYEKLRNFQKLEKCYQHLAQAYASVLDVMKSGKRLLGKYYRVAFFGQTFFEEEDGKEYVYKEPKVTSLAEIIERMKNLYTEKHGKDAVQFIKDSNKVNPTDLDPKYGHIQVTYVTPYFEEKELQDRVTDFERNNTIRRFMYETPFTKGGSAHGSPEEQYKRRTILVTTHTFPYIKKRIEVMQGGRREIVLTPIEVAIDEMQTKVADLREQVNSPVPDAKRLQLSLQGSVSAQVNAGPLAYAEAFLEPEKITKGGYPADKVDKLKEVFRDFVRTCKDALDQNAKLITTDQKEYHESLKSGFMDITERLSILLGEKMVWHDWLNNPRHSMTVLSGSSGTSSA